MNGKVFFNFVLDPNVVKQSELLPKVYPTQPSPLAPRPSHLAPRTSHLAPRTSPLGPRLPVKKS